MHKSNNLTVYYGFPGLLGPNNKERGDYRRETTLADTQAVNHGSRVPLRILYRSCRKDTESGKIAVVDIDTTLLMRALDYSWFLPNPSTRLVEVLSRK